MVIQDAIRIACKTLMGDGKFSYDEKCQAYDCLVSMGAKLSKE